MCVCVGKAVVPLCFLVFKLFKNFSFHLCFIGLIHYRINPLIHYRINPTKHTHKDRDQVPSFFEATEFFC